MVDIYTQACFDLILLVCLIYLFIYFFFFGVGSCIHGKTIYWSPGGDDYMILGKALS
jgi:hypothetical protein